MTEAVTLASIISLLIVALFGVFGIFVYVWTNKINTKVGLVANKVTSLDNKFEKETENKKEKVFVEGHDWDIKDARTDKSFLKITPDNTHMSRLALAYLLLEIEDYLNAKNDEDKKYIENARKRHEIL